jgi:transglutaminase-like putative cysteine protease
VSEATPTVLEVEHETHYGYAAPVTQAQHLAYLKPLQDARQQLLQHELLIEPTPLQLLHDTDSYGNARALFSLNQPHRELRVCARSRVALTPRDTSIEAAGSPRWEDVCERLRYEAGARYDAAVEFAQPSPYVPRLHALRDYGLASFGAGVPVAMGALALMHRIHADFEFKTASTDVDTPLLEAFEQRSGVCQDFAHLMIAALRMVGLAARYVSGYLLTTPAPAPGQEALLGADASHAWVQVYCPETPGLPGGWLELDPTNDLVPDTSHVRLALGRDYGDVTPLRGVIRGGGRHTLDVAVNTRRVQESRARMLLT